MNKIYWHLYGKIGMYEINSVKQLLYNNDVVYRCSKSHQLITAQCNIHRHPWSSSSDMLLHPHSSDRYDVHVNECVMTHARPQVNVIIICTFLVSSYKFPLLHWYCSPSPSHIFGFYAFSSPPLQVFPYPF